MIVVSNKLITAIKLGPIPAYRIAQQARIDPSTLSKLICGIIKVKNGDPRVLAVGNVLGFSAEDCFDEDEMNVSESPYKERFENSISRKT